MSKKIIKHSGPFPISNAVLTNNKYLMEISGQIGVNSETGEMSDDIEEQTIQTIENIKNILKEVGWDLSHVIKTRVYLSDMENYVKMNKIYGEHFTKDYPARVAMAVKELPRKALVEIEAIASGDEIKE